MNISRCGWWSEKEIEHHNTKRHQIFKRELYIGLGKRTKAENREKLEAFKKEFENLI